MEKTLKIGIVIADIEEYLPFEPYAKRGEWRDGGFFGREGIIFGLEGEKRRAEVHCVVCKIGKVNAAAAATHLIDMGADIILNFGLSGGVSRVNRGDLVIAEVKIDENGDEYFSDIEDDDEYEKVADAFDEYLDNCEFDELVDEE